MITNLPQGSKYRIFSTFLRWFASRALGNKENVYVRVLVGLLNRVEVIASCFGVIRLGVGEISSFMSLGCFFNVGRLDFVFTFVVCLTCLWMDDGNWISGEWSGVGSWKLEV